MTGAQDLAYLEWVKELETSLDVRSFYAAKLHELEALRSDLLARKRSLASSPLARVQMDDVEEPVDMRDLIAKHLNTLLAPVERDIKRFTAKLRRANGIAPPKGTFDLDAIRLVPIETLLPTSPKHRTEQRMTVCCPFHVEKTPSCTIYRKQNTFYCFGCGAHGDVISFVMKRENLPFKKACEYLLSYI